ncbi:hypothetical protein M5C72_02820 [Companilactobacillus allii]|uniref:Uncharacterized protein n=1 Tax=Companilactobacillus allii TaxID=1847728 RepID=A0A1P8Q2P5_9LACO|nr:hypothetical protein [Companilactobacillus allii]APX72096.1 hypothetical protein BTM29_05740 [Companilactobacillus allii]USQ69188.1 hypothetical protein M5C72_02820 [Companilactobacillus allii]
MTKVALMLDDNRNITNFAEYPYSLNQDTSKGWILVESDPAFNISDISNWTIRGSDNKLVHISSNQTPDEENQNAITELTKQGLNQVLTVGQIQSAVTEVTKQNLDLARDNIQLKQDKTDMQSAITELTKQVITLSTPVSTTETTTK